MEKIINLILLLFLLVLGVIFYFVLMVTVLPKLLKIESSIRTSSDRGLKKYIYPEGRGIVYEPHPSIRKYVNRYVLYTKDGYKYLKCKLDISVERLNYSVVMFNRFNRVIDVIEVSERNISLGETQAVTLHGDTSYIAFVLDSVNEEWFDREPIMCCKLWRLPAYVGAVGALSFVDMVAITKVLDKCDKKWFHVGLVEAVTNSSLIIPAVCLGLVAGAWAFLNIRSKGIRWTR